MSMVASARFEEISRDRDALHLGLEDGERTSGRDSSCRTTSHLLDESLVFAFGKTAMAQARGWCLHQWWLQLSASGSRTGLTIGRRWMGHQYGRRSWASAQSDDECAACR